MARPLRYLPPDCPLIEVTCRTVQGRMLLRPSLKLNRIVLGVVARAASRYAMGVCHFVFLSNHCHLLLRPTSAEQLARFMNYLNSVSNHGSSQSGFVIRMRNGGTSPIAGHLDSTAIPRRS